VHAPLEPSAARSHCGRRRAFNLIVLEGYLLIACDPLPSAGPQSDNSMQLDIVFTDNYVMGSNWREETARVQGRRTGLVAGEALDPALTIW
jgi:hypothetical protein